MKEKLTEIVRYYCCEKWDEKGILENPRQDGFAIQIYFCPECGNQLRDLPTCPYGKTIENEIIMCALEKEHLDCKRRLLFTHLLRVEKTAPMTNKGKERK